MIIKKPAILSVFLLLVHTCTWAQPAADEERISTSVDTTRSGELVMIQEFTVDVPVQAVWDAYTTREGWEGWAVPLAEVDFRISGTIRTNYNPDGAIGDSTTITTHIINYVPHRLITLQAEITENFPRFMKEDEEDLYNIIQFDSVDTGRTRVISYGIGYKNTEPYLDLLDFFIQGNRETLLSLINYLESDGR